MGLAGARHDRLAGEVGEDDEGREHEPDQLREGVTEGSMTGCDSSRFWPGGGTT